MEFFSRYKKILMIAGFILLSIAIGYLIYLFFFRSAMPEETVSGGETPSGSSTGLPSTGAGGGSAISGDTGGRLSFIESESGSVSETAKGGATLVGSLVDSPTLGARAAGNSVVYYDQIQSQFFRLDALGDPIALSDKKFYSARNVIFSPDGEKAIIEYPDGANIYYDFNSEKQSTLPAHWEDFGFSSDGSSIAFKSIGADVDNRWLAVANADGSAARTIEPLGENADNLQVSWSPNSQMIGIYSESVTYSADGGSQEIYFIGLNGENFPLLKISGRGIVPLWSKDGKYLLYSAYSVDDLMPKLWMASVSAEETGTAKKDLALETWADKCVFSDGGAVYCGVPRDLPEGSGLMRDLAATSTDDLYEINILTGSKKKIASLAGDYNISGPSISENGSVFYFTDSLTGGVKSVKLK